MGMITHSVKNDVSDGISSAIELDDISVIIERLLNNADYPYFGIKGESLTSALRKASGVEKGLYVSSVETSSPALNAKLQIGDIITAINGVPVDNMKTFADLILTYQPKNSITVSIVRMTASGSYASDDLAVILAKKGN